MSRIKQLLKEEELLPHEKEWLDIFYKYPFLDDNEIIGYWVCIKDGAKQTAELYAKIRKQELITIKKC